MIDLGFDDNVIFVLVLQEPCVELSHDVVYLLLLFIDVFKIRHKVINVFELKHGILIFETIFYKSLTFYTILVFIFFIDNFAEILDGLA